MLPPPHAEKRHHKPSSVRLIQMDIAARDERAPIGWIFGTFMYDGTGVRVRTRDHPVGSPLIDDQDQQYRSRWDGLIPVGLMWGNDPELTQEEFEKGKKPVESWINPDADYIRIKLGGTRPFWGWNGRLNG